MNLLESHLSAATTYMLSVVPTLQQAGTSYACGFVEMTALRFAAHESLRAGGRPPFSAAKAHRMS